MSNLDISKSYLSAFAKKDYRKMRTLMDDRFTFKGPMTQASSPEAFIKELEPMMKDWSFEFDYKATAEDGDNSVLYYNCVMPQKGSVRMAEWHKIRDGKIVSAECFFDPKDFGAPQ